MTITLRKFYDPAVAESPASTEQPSIAQLMATKGVMNQTGNPVATPIDITEKKEEPKPVTEPTPAATATSTTPTDTAISEPPKQTEEPKEPPKVEIPQEQPKVPSWQEVLKSQQPDTVFKELGFDDKMVKVVSQLKDLDPKVIGLIEAYKEGKHVDYLRELTTDYSRMTPEEVMRHQLSLDYPKASPQQLDAIFKREVIKAYSLDSVDEEEQAEGKLLLEAKADNYREKLIANQQAYLVPKYTEPKAPELDNQVEEQKKVFEAYKADFDNNQYTKDIFANKKIVIGDGDEKFTFDVEPQEIQQTLYNGQKWLEKTSIVTTNPDGSKSFKPNARLQNLIGALATYGEPFLEKYAQHLKSLGGKKVVDTLENASQPNSNTTSQSQKAPETVAEAMARQGRVNYGGGTQ